MKRLLALFLFAGLACGQQAVVGSLTSGGSTCTPTNCLEINIEGTAYTTVAVQISGTWSATVQFEGLVDTSGGDPSSSLWFATLVNTMNGTTETTSTTANGVWTVTSAGYARFRVRVSAYTSGTVVVALRPSMATAVNTTSTSALGLTQSFNMGATLGEKGPRWSVVSTPAVSTLATASKAAGAAGVRHVADCITFSAGSTTAPALTQLTINLRDGATGAGTVIWSHTVIIPATTGQNVLPYSVCGLNLIGSAATAMTFEFSALLTNLFENVSISGYDVQ